MKIVTCTLENASNSINGVAFTQTETGMVSEPVADEVAAQFDGIPGYTSFDPDGSAKAPKAAKSPAASKE